MYYEQEENAGPAGSFDHQHQQHFSGEKDYMEPNQPFIQKSKFAPGGILAQYKKHIGLTAKDVMEQDYFAKMRDLHIEAGDHFNVVSQNEKDMMATTKNLITRTRMQREIEWGNEDFRKKILTQDYGNYEKYEKNAVN